MVRYNIWVPKVDRLAGGRVDRVDSPSSVTGRERESYGGLIGQTFMVNVGVKTSSTTILPLCTLVTALECFPKRTSLQS